MRLLFNFAHTHTNRTRIDYSLCGSFNTKVLQNILKSFFSRALSAVQFSILLLLSYCTQRKGLFACVIGRIIRNRSYLFSHCIYHTHIIYIQYRYQPRRFFFFSFFFSLLFYRHTAKYTYKKVASARCSKLFTFEYICIQKSQSAIYFAVFFIRFLR